MHQSWSHCTSLNYIFLGSVVKSAQLSNIMHLNTLNFIEPVYKRLKLTPPGLKCAYWKVGLEISVSWWLILWHILIYCTVFLCMSLSKVHLLSCLLLMICWKPIFAKYLLTYKQAEEKKQIITLRERQQDKIQLQSFMFLLLPAFLSLTLSFCPCFPFFFLFPFFYTFSFLHPSYCMCFLPFCPSFDFFSR